MPPTAAKTFNVFKESEGVLTYRKPTAFSVKGLNEAFDSDTKPCYLQ